MRMFRVSLIWLIFALAGSVQGLPLDLEPPTVSLYDVQIVNLTSTEQTFAVELKVKNPNLMDIPVSGLTYQMDLNGKQIAHGARDEPVTLPGLGERIVELQAVTSVNSLMQQLRAMMQSGSSTADYSIHGEVRIGEGATPFPFDQQGQIDLRELMGLGRDAPPPDYI